MQSLPDRHPPALNYCGLTVIISNPSRFDTESLISGQAGEWFQHCLGNTINRHACDIRTIDCAAPILSGTKVILLMGFRALEYLNKQSEATLSQLRGSPFLRDNIWHIATYHPQDTIDRKNYEAKLNKHIIEFEEDNDDDEEKEAEDTNAIKNKGRTSRSNFRFWFKADVQKAERILRESCNQNTCVYSIYPGISSIRDTLSRWVNQPIFLDIETNPETQQLICFAISDGAKRVLCIPIRRYDGKLCYDEGTTAEIFQLLARVFRDNTIVVHYALFDLFILLWKWRIPPPPYKQIYCTMTVHARLFPGLERSLGHCISLYTNQTYHKNESKFFTHNSAQDTQLWTYCAKDVETLALVYEGQKQYVANFAAQSSVDNGNRGIRAFLTIIYRGVLVETTKLCSSIDKLERKKEFFESKVLNELVGYPLNPRSPDKVANYLYNELKLKRPGRGSLTGKKSMYRLQIKYEVPAITLILALRRWSTEQGKLCSVLWHNNRWTGAYNLGATKTFRLGCNKLLGYWGTNMMNFNKRSKKYVMPDEGYELVQVDLAGVEAHIVAYMTPPGGKYRQLFDNKIKVHTYLAMFLFTQHWNDVMGKNIESLLECPITELKQQPDWKQLATAIKESDDDIPSRRYYYFAKQTCHSGNYDITAPTLCLNTLEKSEGEVRLPVREGARFLDTYHNTLFPEIRLHFHNLVRYMAETDGKLVNLLGFPRYIYQPIDDIIKDLYSWIPQSTGSACMAIAAATSMQALLDEGHEEPWFMMLQDNHDSLLGQCKIGRAQELATLMSKHLDIPLTSPYGETFHIGSEAQTSRTNWGEMITI